MNRDLPGPAAWLLLALAVAVLLALAAAVGRRLKRVSPPAPDDLEAVADATREPRAADQPCPACTGRSPHCTCAVNCGDSRCRGMLSAGFADWERDYNDQNDQNGTTS